MIDLYGRWHPDYPGQQMMQDPMVKQAQAQSSQQQTQSGGFMPAPNEVYALNYPVAPGNSMTFKIEGKPIVIEKSMGFSQLESPKIDRYRLVKETLSEASDEPIGTTHDDDGLILNTIDSIKGEIETIWSEIEGLKKKPASRTKKREVEDDDTE